MLGGVRRGAAVLTAAMAVVAVGGCASEGTEPAERIAQEPPVRVKATIADWRWAPRDQDPPRRERPPEPAREKTPEPDPAPPRAAERDEPAKPPPLPDLGGGDATLARAAVMKNGIALPPLEAPPEVRAIFEAGNVIARSPYKWGGGHGKWQDTGYDCSGSVSYALAAAGLVDAPMASGPFMGWGRPGKGKWVTIYANPGHMFLVVAGVRFDTVARKTEGSRWIDAPTSTSGYVARHPPGL